MKKIKFKNIGRDFEEEFVLKGFTKSGRMKIQEIVGSGPKGLTLGRNRLTTKKGKRHWIYESGSPLNSYYRDE